MSLYLLHAFNTRSVINCSWPYCLLIIEDLTACANSCCSALFLMFLSSWQVKVGSISRVLSRAIWKPSETSTGVKPLLKKRK